MSYVTVHTYNPALPLGVREMEGVGEPLAGWSANPVNGELSVQ